MIDEAAIRLRWETVGAPLDERGRRLFAAVEARSAGRDGLALVSKITGLARSTINRGEDDLDGEPLAKGRVRRAGGGRRSVSEADPGLVPALKRLVEPATLGDPTRPLMWVSKSMAKLAAALTEMGHPISADTVGTELAKLGFSRQSNRKADDGSHHPDRNAQFEHINAKVVAAQARQQPVISVDTKKKELLGNFKNGGTDYRPKGDPRRVNLHDFEDKKLGKVVPYGVYDVTANAGFVSVGITSDTAEFAVASIRCWLERMGRQRYARRHSRDARFTFVTGTRVRLTPLDARLTRLLTTIPIDVQREGLSLASLQASLRGRSRGNCHPGELGAAMRRLGFQRRRDWSGSAKCRWKPALRRSVWPAIPSCLPRSTSATPTSNRCTPSSEWEPHQPATPE